MALTTWSAFVAAHPEKANSCTQTLLVAKGVSANELYMMEVDPVSGKLPVDATTSAAVLGFGDPASATRGASQIGNATGACDFGSGVQGAQTLRVTPATDAPHLLATRHEAAATPLSAQISNGSAFAAFGSGVMGNTVLRITPATDAQFLLNIRHETAATPLVFRMSDGSVFRDFQFGNGAVSSTTLRNTPGSDAPHLLNTRHENVATPLAFKLSTGSSAVDYNAGTVGAATLRTNPATDAPHLLATRHEAASTPLSMRLTDATAFLASQALTSSQSSFATARSLNSSSVAYGFDSTNLVHKELLVDTSGNLIAAPLAATAATAGEGTILGTNLTGAYATALTLSADVAILLIRNTCNQEILVSMDGSTDHFTMAQGDQISIDFKANYRKLSSGATIKAKHAGVAPTAGKIKVTAIY